MKTMLLLMQLLDDHDNDDHTADADDDDNDNHSNDDYDVAAAAAVAMMIMITIMATMVLMDDYADDADDALFLVLLPQLLHLWSDKDDGDNSAEDDADDNDDVLFLVLLPQLLHLWSDNDGGDNSANDNDDVLFLVLLPQLLHLWSDKDDGDNSADDDADHNDDVLFLVLLPQLFHAGRSAGQSAHPVPGARRDLRCHAASWRPNDVQPPSLQPARRHPGNQGVGWGWGGGVEASLVQLVERWTEKPDAILSRVRVPGAARLLLLLLLLLLLVLLLLLPESAFSADSLTVSVQPPCAIACISICTEYRIQKFYCL